MALLYWGGRIEHVLGWSGVRRNHGIGKSSIVFIVAT
jgi:hypothetical protein